MPTATLADARRGFDGAVRAIDWCAIFSLRFRLLVDRARTTRAVDGARLER